MEIKSGAVIKSLHGHDKGSFYVVIGYDKKTNMPLIADGRRRKIEKPKPKNPKHISVTNTTLSPTDIDSIDNLTNKKLRGILHKFNFPGEYGEQEQEHE